MTVPTPAPPPSTLRFSATEAAFEGFRLLRVQPGLLLAWSLVSLAFSFVIGLATVGMVGPQMMRLAQLQALGQAAPPQAVLGAMSAMGPFYVLLMVAALAVYAVMSAAVNRAVLRPLEGGFGRLRLGAAELLQAAAMALLWLIFFVAYIVVAIVAVIVAVVLGIALAAVSSKAATAAAVVIGLAAVFLGLIYLMVRLSLLTPLTFDLGRVDLGAAWRLTRGRVLPLFGAYLLASLLMMVVTLAFLVAFTAVAAVLGGGLSAAGALMHPDMTSVSAYFQPVQIAYLLLASLLAGLWYAVLFGAPAQAYAQLAALDARAATPAPLTQGF